MRHLLALSMVSLALIMVVPDSTLGDAHPETRVEVDAPGWHVVTILEPGPILDASAVTNTSHPAAIGIFAYDWQGQLLRRSVAGVAGEGAHVAAHLPEAEASPSVMVRDETPNHVSFGAGLRLTSPPDVVHLVFWMAAHDGQWHYEYWAQDGGRIIHRDAGPETYYIDGSQLRHGPNARAQVLFAEAQAAHGASVELDVAHNMIGFFGFGFTSGTTSEIRVESPDGTMTECPCELTAVAGADALGAGRYRVHWSGAAADVAHPVVAMIDPRVPTG